METQIISIGTAVPENKISQTSILNFMTQVSDLDTDERRKLAALYRSTGIKFRHSVIKDYNQIPENFQFFPKNKFLEPFPTIGSRMRLYKEHALPLCIEAIKKCLDGYKIDLKEITHIITVSCTGMYAPGLDIEIIEELGLNTDTQRTSINFMGCYAALNALRIADYICKIDKKVNILLVCVELCTIHFQKKKSSDNFLSNSIFADGAAALLISNEKSEGALSLNLAKIYSDFYPLGKKDMAWHIADFGFEMVLSSFIPDIIKQGIRGLCDKLLEKMPVNLSEINFFAIHPGGKGILEAIEKELDIKKEANENAYHVLSEYGNMSSPTILFVLNEFWKKINRNDNGKLLLSMAFGPGLTIEAGLLKVSF